MRFLLAAIAVLALAGPAQVQAQAQPQGQAGGANACPVAGLYKVLGQVPGAKGAYTGSVAVMPSNGRCAIQWRTPDLVNGAGAFRDGFLAATFTMQGGEGVAVYTRNPDGTMDGVWWRRSAPDVKGSERWVPDPKGAL